MKLNNLLKEIVLPVGIVGGSYFSIANEGESKSEPVFFRVPSIVEVSNYPRVLDEIEAKQDSFALEYRNASELEKETLVGESRDYVYDTLVNDVLPFWIGTPWDFNGTTQTPGEGSIACGYFISTTLEDTGFDIERISLAQQASENIIKSLTDKDNISRLNNASIGKFKDLVKEKGEGLYVLGLDYHVGYVINDDNQLRFFHSNYYDPWQVVDESVDGSLPIFHSKYKVLGKLFNDEMMEKWLKNEHFDTVK
jgi:hypothetical protein